MSGANNMIMSGAVSGALSGAIMSEQLFFKYKVTPLSKN